MQTRSPTFIDLKFSVLSSQLCKAYNCLKLVCFANGLFIFPYNRTRQCRVPTINRGRDTALPCPLQLIVSSCVFMGGLARPPHKKIHQLWNRHLACLIDFQVNRKTIAPTAATNTQHQPPRFDPTPATAESQATPSHCLSQAYPGQRGRSHF